MLVKKKSSIRSKVLIPFIVIIAMMGLSCIFISIFMLSDTMYKYTTKSLKQDHHIINQNLQTIEYTLENMLTLLPHLKRLSPYKLKTLIPKTETLQLLDWQDFRLLTSYSEITPVELSKDNPANEPDCKE